MEFLKIKIINQNATIPSSANDGDAGYDISSCEDITVKARQRSIIKTGICIGVPKGTYGRIAPRSGLTTKKGIDVGAGVVDRSYTGEVCVILFNHSDIDFEVKIGDRIAQLILECIKTPDITVVDELCETIRGDKGFGSSGL